MGDNITRGSQLPCHLPGQPAVSVDAQPDQGQPGMTCVEFFVRLLKDESAIPGEGLNGAIALFVKIVFVNILKNNGQNSNLS